MQVYVSLQAKGAARCRIRGFTRSPAIANRPDALVT